MNQDLLDRLMAALNRNPELEYQLWLTMQNLRFYGPWKLQHGSWIVEDNRGRLVGSVSPAHDGFHWTSDTHLNHPAVTAEEGKRQVEHALAGKGWRRAPDHLWQAAPCPEAKPSSRLTPWVYEGETWRRYYQPQAEVVAASVSFDDTVRIWGGRIHRFEGEDPTFSPPAVQGANTKEYLQYLVDHVLEAEGLITFLEMTPDPTIPF